MTPRCGKPMNRYEAANGPMLDDPQCGRPAGHPGPCRSAVSLARQYPKDAARITEGRRTGRYRRLPAAWPTRRAA